MASTYLYPDLATASRAVRECGEKIAQYGLPSALGPMTFVFTGRGKVYNGAEQIFKLLPHEWVAPEDLPRLVQGKQGDLRRVYGCRVSAEHMVEHADGSAFDKVHYYANPDQYRPVFHERIAPHMSVLMNCMYWSQQFPRLLTKEQMRRLAASGSSRLLAVGDISCDIGGSVEFLTRPSTIERPFYLYDSRADMVHDNLDDEGVMMMGVDNLPAELPKDASQSFGDALLPFVPALASSNGTLPFDRQHDLPAEIRGAVVTDQGQLAPSFKYIQQLRKDSERAAGRAAARTDAGDKRLLMLRGHLFDYSLINRVLDLAEHSPCDLRILQCRVGSSRDEMTTAVLEMGGERDVMDELVNKMQVLVGQLAGLPGLTDTVLRTLPHGSHHAHAEATPAAPDAAAAAGGAGAGAASASAPGAPGAPGGAEQELLARLPASVRDMGAKKVLVLGSGLVSSPVLDYLHRVPGTAITVATQDVAEAQRRAADRRRIRSTHLDLVQHSEKLQALVQEHDMVISLVPAPMHASVARPCIAARRPLVTASYVSPEMRALDAEAKAAGVGILCELGLDPGLDHMSAMRMIRDARRDGAAIHSFVSVCGGLPAPEAADNPLGYKFSWSPRGVLTAGRNSARCRVQGQELRVPGDQLFRHARPIEIGAAMALEQLPNRDSVPYAAAYGIPDVPTVYRGTLRYRGFSEIMAHFADMGLFDDAASPNLAGRTWRDVMLSLLPAGTQDPREGMLRRLRLLVDANQTERVLGAMDFLGLFSDSPVSGSTMLDALCARLQSRLQYGPKERDMVLLHHKLGVTLPDGRKETRTSTLQAYGVVGGYTAMAATVGLPVAISASLILSGQLKLKGVHIPTAPEVYDPVLDAMEREGFAFVERAQQETR